MAASKSRRSADGIAPERGESGILLFYGNDEVAVKRAASGEVARRMPADPMNFETIDGQADSGDAALRSIDELQAALLTLPFFGGGKLVWWKNVNFLDDGAVGKLAAVKEALEGLKPRLEAADGRSVTLVISALALHKGRVFGKALLQMARSQAFDLPDLRQASEEDVLDRVEDECRLAGLSMTPEALERLAQAIGLNPALLRTEVEKLAVYLGAEKREVRGEDVEAIVAGRREVLVWDFCDAVLAGKAKAAVALLHNLIEQGESEVGVLILLTGQVRQAALASTLLEAGWMTLSARGRFVTVDLRPEAEEILPRKKTGEPISTYNLGRVAQQAKHRPASHWRGALDVLHEAALQMVTGTGDKARTLEHAVLRLALD